MKRIISLALIISVVTLGLSSFISSTIPDPEIFGKEFIETIKKGSKENYINKYAITKEDITWIKSEITANPYVSEEMKKNYLEYMINDKSYITKMHQRLSENYDVIANWIKSDTIDLTQVSYITTFYDVKYFNNTLYKVLDEGVVFIKHKANYYKIIVYQVGFVNNKWAYGQGIQIKKVDQYLNRIPNRTMYDQTYSDITQSSPIVDTMISYDTMSVYQEEYPISDEKIVIDNNQNQYTGLNTKQAKKIDKLQKQIDALYIKMDKEYSKEY